MTPHDETDDTPDLCSQPCAPWLGCPQCLDYWNRMRHEGYWIDGQGWTAKGMREMSK
jgi:hypothetical protein